MKEETLQNIDQEQGKGLATASRVIDIIVFTLTMLALTAAIISDFAIFAEQILTIIAGFIVACIMFMVFLIAFFLSVILVFGVYLMDTYGFWPLTLSSELCQQALHDAAISDEQISVLLAIRMILLVVCIVCFIGAIVSSVLKKAAKKQGFAGKTKGTTAFSTLALIFSLFGIALSALILLIASGVVG